MFERFTESARRALFFARYEVTTLGGAMIERDHLLLGVMRASEPLLAKTFGVAAATQSDLRAAIARRSADRPKVPTSEEIPFSLGAKRVLEFAAKEANSLKHAHIGPEHLLLGLLCEESGETNGDLSSRGISLKGAREHAATLASQDTSDGMLDATVYMAGAERAVGDAIERLHEAIRTRDVETAAAAFAPGAVMFILSPPLQFTAEAGPGRDRIRDWFASFDGPIGYDVRDLRIAAGPDLALSHALIRIAGKRSDGSVTDIWVRETLGLRLLDMEWKVIHQHQSVPFYMDGSNRAAIDLKP